MVMGQQYGGGRTRIAWLSPALLAALLSPVVAQTGTPLSCRSGDTSLIELAVIVDGENRIEFAQATRDYEAWVVPWVNGGVVRAVPRDLDALVWINAYADSGHTTLMGAVVGGGEVPLPIESGTTTIRVYVKAPGGASDSYDVRLDVGTDSATVLQVPLEYPSIQAAIDEAAPTGDTVYVAPGTYFENLNFFGKDVIVASAEGPKETAIDAGRGTGVKMGPGGTLLGFTVTNAEAPFGAGVAVSGSGSVIRANIFDGNTATAGGYGAGVGGNGSSPLIDRNLFRSNQCDSQFVAGVVAFINASSPTISNNVFDNNACTAINLTRSSNSFPLVINNTVVGSPVGIRVNGLYPSTTQAYRNNVVVHNDVGLELDSPHRITWDHNLVYGNVTNYIGLVDQTEQSGNLSVPPQFVDESAGDYRLLPTSPAVDAGSSLTTPAADFAGLVRPADGDVDGCASADMGAHELQAGGPDVGDEGGCGTGGAGGAGGAGGPAPGCMEAEHGLGDPSPDAELVETDYIKASNGGAGDEFGSVAICGDTLVVGAPFEDSRADGVQTHQGMENAGAVYVFERRGGTWRQTAFLKASDAKEWAQFGTRVALSGDLLAVSAIGEGTAGTVYLFERFDGFWYETAQLAPSNAQLNDLFGDSIAIAEDTVVVTAPWEDGGFGGVNPDGANNDLDYSGAAYVFERDGDSWRQAAYLKAETPEAWELFGLSVAMSGATIAVGAGGDSSVYVFDRVDGNWVQTSRLFATSPADGYSFGRSVSLWGNRMAVGAGGEEFSRGAAYVLERQGPSWVQTARLVASNRGSSDGFGNEIVVHENRIAVGAPYEDSPAAGINGDGSSNGAGSSGAAYLFELVEGSWTETAYIKASDPQPVDFFGQSISMTSRTLAIGAPSEDGFGTGVGAEQDDFRTAEDSGAVYVFAK